MRRVLGLAGLAALGLVVVEVVLFVLAVRQFGAALTLFAVLVTALLGGWLARREGIRGWRRFQTAVAEGRPPGREATHSLLGLVAGVLLVLPGFVSDVIGLLLLVPPVRWAAREGIERTAARRISTQWTGTVFGPRRVRVRRGRPVRTGGTAPVDGEPPVAGTSPQPDSPPPNSPPAAIEGEIVDPGR